MRGLLAIRDALQEHDGPARPIVSSPTTRPTSRRRCGVADAETLRSSSPRTGRGIGHLAAVALRNVDWLLTPARAGAPRRPVLDVLAPGVGAYRGEVVLTEKADPPPTIRCSGCARPRPRPCVTSS